MVEVLRGMTWDHLRGAAPLVAAAQEWQMSRQLDVEVHWHARPLKAFEDQGLEELVSSYDLVMLDHPFIGRAAEGQLLVPVDEWVDEEYLADQRAHSVGPSFSSYTWASGHWPRTPPPKLAPRVPT